MRRLALAAAIAFVLLVYIALHGVLKAPKYTPLVDLEEASKLIRENPALYAEVLKYINKSGLNLTIYLPPRAKPTEITLSVDKAVVTAGDVVAVSGRLTSNGVPLRSQAVAIYLGGRLVAVPITDNNGNFKASFNVSVYRPTVEVTALYVPPPGAEYKPSNATAILRVVYYETRLDLQTTPSVKWGEELILRVRETPPVERKVVITLSNSSGVIYATSVVLKGEAEVVIPTRDIPPGRYVVVAKAEGRGSYAPSLARAEVMINAEIPAVVLNNPPVALAGFPLSVEILTQPPVGASIFLNGRPLQGAVPLDTPTGYAELTARTIPNPPYASAEVSTEVFIINLLQFIPLAVVPVFLIFRRQSREQPYVKVVEEVAAASPRRVFTATEQEVIALLAFVFQKLGGRAGVFYSRKMTYREYAAAVEKYTADPYCLWYVVELAERTFYSVSAPNLLEISSAWTCAVRL